MIIDALKCPQMVLLGSVGTNSPTSARHENDLEYIKILGTPFRKLVFCDGAPNPYKLYQLLHARRFPRNEFG